LPDKGENEGGGEIVKRGSLKLKLAGLPEGAYKIELKANDDIITEKIVSKQRRLSFINKLWLAKRGDSEIVLYTDSKEIKAQTVNPKSLQTIKVGNNELAMDETYRQFAIKLPSGRAAKTIELERGDVILAGDGVFSFKKDGLINPKFKKVDANLDVDRDGVNYILANYEIPRNEGEWKIARAEFDLTRAYRENGKYGFLISVPGLRADDEIDDYVEIRGNQG